MYYYSEDNRLYEDNRELELRKDHKKLTRSHSDVSDNRMYRSKTETGKNVYQCITNRYGHHFILQTNIDAILYSK